jgi:hypothetical protein
VGFVEGDAKGPGVRVVVPDVVPLPGRRDGVGDVDAFGHPAELHEGGIEHPEAVAGLDAFH